jgi:hypothetical protein
MSILTEQQLKDCWGQPTVLNTQQLIDYGRAVESSVCAALVAALSQEQPADQFLSDTWHAGYAAALYDLKKMIK